jgi:hypothetical protein
MVGSESWAAPNAMAAAGAAGAAAASGAAVYDKSGCIGHTLGVC